MPKSKSLVRAKQLVADRDPWEKQPWESWKAFEAFSRFRDMGSTRTLRRLAELTAEASRTRRADSVESQLKDWSQRNLWPARIEAYTLHMDRVRVEAREEQHRRIEAEDMEISEQMLRLVRNSTDLLDDLHAGIPLELVDRWIERAVKIRRLAAGMSTDNVKAGLVITSTDMHRVLNRVVDLACDFIAPEQREEFIRRVTDEAGG